MRSYEALHDHAVLHIGTSHSHYSNKNRPVKEKLKETLPSGECTASVPATRTHLITSQLNQFELDCNELIGLVIEL